MEVPTLSGDMVKVKIPAGSSTDKLLRVKGQGLKSARGSVGDLYVRVKVIVPKSLSQESRQVIEAFRDTMGAADPRAEFRDMAKV